MPIDPLTILNAAVLAFAAVAVFEVALVTLRLPAWVAPLGNEESAQQHGSRGRAPRHH